MSGPNNDISSRMKRLRRRITYSKWFIEVLSVFGFVLVWLLAKTLRTRVDYDPSLSEVGRARSLFAFWHGRQFLLVPNFGLWNIAILSDVSWAGEIQSRILKKFGYDIVRGSSTRGGLRALLQLKKEMESGLSGAFAVDGPHGPIFRTKPGIVFLAQKMRLPIIPVATSARRAWVLKDTWCHYLLPKPFSVCTVLFGPPLPADGDFETLTVNQVDHALDTLSFEADRRMQVEFYRLAKASTENPKGAV